DGVAGDGNDADALRRTVDEARTCNDIAGDATAAEGKNAVAKVSQGGGPCCIGADEVAQHDAVGAKHDADAIRRNDIAFDAVRVAEVEDSFAVRDLLARTLTVAQGNVAGGIGADIVAGNDVIVRRPGKVLDVDSGSNVPRDHVALGGVIDSVAVGADQVV